MKIFLSQREFWNQVKKKKKERERELEKERENGAPGTLNEGEKESKRGGRDSGQCVEEKKKKKEIKLIRMVESEMEKEKII